MKDPFTLKWLKTSFSDPLIAEPLINEIHNLAKEINRQITIMEVCGTHTMAIRSSGVHSLLPSNVRMISGPGCPVCITPTGYIDNALLLAEKGDVIIATFGDMLKIPGGGGFSLSHYMGTGRIHTIYSPSELIPLAQKSSLPVVFLGIGFETTIPAIATVFLKAASADMNDLYLYTAFKTVPPALKALLIAEDRNFDALLLPGHVSVIIGTKIYKFLEEEGGVPGVIAGFEPLDLLAGILSILRQISSGEQKVENAYPRAVRTEGNPKAQDFINTLLEPSDELWRGLGSIPQSGLSLRHEFKNLDPTDRFNIPEVRNSEPPGCCCAQVIQGITLPYQCSLFGKTCTPEKPVGPCMVSTEGTCSAYFRYENINGDMN